MECSSPKLRWLLSSLLLSHFLPDASVAASPVAIHGSTDGLYGRTRMSEFRVLNRRLMGDCPDPNPYLAVNVGAASLLPDEGNVTVTVSGVAVPAKSDWVAMISPSGSDVSDCPFDTIMYKQTGDFARLPLLCHYPLKAQYVSNDPSYLNCDKSECSKAVGDDDCLVRTCSGSITFHFVNIRTDIEFVFLAGGFDSPCVLRRSEPLKFANPNKPLYGHLSSIDSTGTSMRVTWVSGDPNPQQVQYGGEKSATAVVTTFTRNDMCSGTIASPAKDFGWHDPGYIHSAEMTGLKPSQSYSYRYGSDSVGWSGEIKFKTPPAAGTDELRFLAYGDMGKEPLDQSVEHYIQPGSRSVVEAMASEVETGNVDSIFHIGDISYATGFLVEWEFFLNLISPVASRVSYMTAIGNHERDYADSGSVYQTPDSGGECGVAYESYFQMPTSAKDKPWYSIEQASVHFTVISTEHPWDEKSEQYEWILQDMASIDRARTPWLIFMGHRPMYSTHAGILNPDVDPDFVKSVEPLLMDNKVDLVLFGHVHNYERTCAIYQNECKGMPVKDKDGADSYDSTDYTAPVHAIIGMAGFSLDKFPSNAASWSLSRISEFGYARIHATKEDLGVEENKGSSSSNQRRDWRQQEFQRQHAETAGQPVAQSNDSTILESKLAATTQQRIVQVQQKKEEAATTAILSNNRRTTAWRRFGRWFPGRQSNRQSIRQPVMQVSAAKNRPAKVFFSAAPGKNFGSPGSLFSSQKQQQQKI